MTEPRFDENPYAPPKTTESVAPARAPSLPRWRAILGFILNLMFPGVGSWVVGRFGAGLIQCVLIIFGLPLCIVLVGAPMVIGSFLWAVYASSLDLVSDAETRSSARARWLAAAITAGILAVLVGILWVEK